jgi:AcrR family transcriptional regulator
VYPRGVPKLWSDTIEGHRRAVRTAAIEAAAELVGERGLAGVTMSAIAERAGVGRATLYKHFPDVEAVLLAWHEHHVEQHLQRLTEVRDRSPDPDSWLQAVLDTYGQAIRHQRGTGVGAFLHNSDHVARAHRRLAEFLHDLIDEARQRGAVREDVPIDELTSYCFNALNAALALPTDEAVHRLVAVVLAGLKPP